jgi:hypothetical protein
MAPLDDSTSPHTSAPPGAPAAPEVPSPLDEPIDAIVYEVHPSLRPPAGRAISYGGDYPYGPPASLDAASHDPALSGLDGGWLIDAFAWLVRSADKYYAAVQSPPDFVVPKTFGMSAILGIMTALAMLFAILRWAGAEPVFYFFFSVEALAICLAQMLYGQTPRLASIIAGAVILPTFTLLAAFFVPDNSGALICLAIGFIPVGAVLGYLTGTCAAGIFLVMDYVEPYMHWHALSSLVRSRHAAS